MSYQALIWILLIVGCIAAVLGLLGDREGPPATRRELDRADRDNKPDISSALERTAEPRPLVVVVVQQPSRNDDPRRWN